MTTVSPSKTPTTTVCSTPLKEKSLLKKPKEEERKMSLSLSKKKKEINPKYSQKILGFYSVVFFLEGFVVF